MTTKLLKQDIIKFEKAFSKLYHRHLELMVKYNIGLKALLQQGISVPIFYGDLVYKFKITVRNPKIIKRYKKKMDITWISCDSLHAWLQTQSRVLAVASSSIARRWVRPQTQ